jgi:hypothetical protein
MAFHLVPATTDIRVLLKGNGITFEDIGHTFYLKRRGINLLKLNVDIFGAAYVNSMVASTGITSVTGLPLCFNKSDAFSKIGMLTNFSPLFKQEAQEAGRSLAESDKMVLDIFNSSEVKHVLYDDEGTIISDPPPATLFKVEDAEILSRDDFLSEDSDGKPIVSFYDEGEERTAFYVAINMRKRSMIPPTVPSMWSTAIQKEQLAFLYDNGTGVLYVSNTIGAYYGFPPTAEHMGVDRLELSMADWESNVYLSDPQQSGEERSTSNANNNSSASWEELIDQFMERPARATFMQLISSGACKELYDECNKQDEYRMGSKKNPQTGLLRQSMLGEGKAKTYEDFANEVRSVAYPASPSHFLVLIYRLRGLIRSTGDGRIYFQTQA